MAPIRSVIWFAMLSTSLMELEPDLSATNEKISGNSGATPPNQRSSASNLDHLARDHLMEDVRFEKCFIYTFQTDYLLDSY